MELMPHIKALLDDLIKMTKNIDVKRTDLANKYEDNTRTVLLYQQTSEILHGMPSFFTYSVPTTSPFLVGTFISFISIS